MSMERTEHIAVRFQGGQLYRCSCVLLAADRVQLLACHVKIGPQLQRRVELLLRFLHATEAPQCQG